MASILYSRRNGESQSTCVPFLRSGQISNRIRQELFEDEFKKEVGRGNATVAERKPAAWKYDIAHEVYLPFTTSILSTHLGDLIIATPNPYKHPLRNVLGSYLLN